MKGYLFDENLPLNTKISPDLPIEHVTKLGPSPTDSEIWQYAKTNDLVIVTKDADFSDRIIITSPPPKVVHLKFGNMKKSQFHSLLKDVWPQIEALLKEHKLINVFQDSFEVVE